MELRPKTNPTTVKGNSLFWRHQSSKWIWQNIAGYRMEYFSQVVLQLHNGCMRRPMTSTQLPRCSARGDSNDSVVIRARSCDKCEKYCIFSALSNQRPRVLATTLLSADKKRFTNIDDWNCFTLTCYWERPECRLPVT